MNVMSLCALASVLAMLSAAPTAEAADTRWFGNNADWFDTDWWVGGVVPTVMHSAQIDGSVIVSKPGAVVGKNFYVGYYSGQEAEVKLDGGDLTTGDSVQVSFFGYGGKGTLRMLDGLFNPTAMCILGDSSSGEGVWLVDGGTIDASAIRMGHSGKGTIIQTGGRIDCAGVTFGHNDGSTGTYEMFGGTLVTSWFRLGPNRFRTAVPTFRILGSYSDITLTADLSLYSANSVFTAVPGSKIKMVGQYASFINEMNAVKAENVNGLKNLTFQFSGNPSGSYCTYEAAGEDRGADVSGYCDGNFTLNTLAVGGDTPGRVVLVDNFNNGNRIGGPECLYVRKLIVTAGSTLNLNGLNLYYLQADIAGTVTGTPQQIWTLDMNGDGTAGMYELMTIAAHWLEDGCICLDRCGGADINADGVVNLLDFTVLAENWLAASPLKQRWRTATLLWKL